MRKVYYEKVGRRYKPVSEYDSDLFEALPSGAHLVICHPGVKSIRQNINPALAPLIAAGKLAEDAVTDAVVKASEMRPTTRPLTLEQQAAWENLAAAFGADIFTIQSNSAHNIANAGIAAMIKEAEKLMTNPAVQDAYNNFLTVCELTRKQS